MPTNLTDTSAFTDPVQVPTAGDPVSAGPGTYLRNALQALANRTRYLYDGVPRIRNVANTAALKAITGAVNGDVAILNGGQIYLYKSGATVGTDLAGYRYDSGVSTGFWASPLYYITTGTPLRLDVSVLAPPNRTSRPPVPRRPHSPGPAAAPGAAPTPPSRWVACRSVTSSR
jgi:hypothetical protein